MSEKLSSLGMGILVACALLLTGMTVRRELTDESGLRSVRSVKQWREFAIGGYVIGAKRPIVTTTIFTDYECPFCRALNRQVDSLLATDSTLQIVFRHFPLEGHPRARPAARAAICASEQHEFRAFHNELFRTATLSDSWDFDKIASSLGLRPGPFRDCLRSTRPDDIIAADVRAGQQLGVQGTPAILVNDKLYFGLPPNFRTLVQSAKPFSVRWSANLMGK